MPYATQDFIHLIPYTAALYFFLLVCLKSRISGFIDPLNIALIYVSFGVVGLANDVVENNLDPSVFYLTILWVFSFVISILLLLKISFIRIPSLNFSTIKIKHDKLFSLSFFWIISVIYLFYFITIVKSGILDVSLKTVVDERFLVFQDSKVIFYIFNAVSMLPAVAMYQLYGNLSMKKFFARILPFWLVQVLTFSKTGFVFPILQYAIFYSLCSMRGGLRNFNIVKYLLGACFAVSFVLFVFYVIAEYLSDSQGGALAINLLLRRLYTSYDALTMYSRMDYSVEPDVSIFQWYLAPFLKQLGLFYQYYNAANFYIAVEYLGYSPSHTGMLPNNNNVLEVSLAFPVIFRPVFIFIFAFFYSFLYRLSMSVASSVSLFSIPLGFIYSTPLGFLVDGQGWSVALTSSFVALFAQLLLYSLLVLFCYVSKKHVFSVT